jgi:arabinofuranosyltransferase
MRAVSVTDARIDPLPVLIIAAFLALLLLFPSWTVDDTYITLRYARNLVEHGQLVWNVGEAPVEGYTGILWTLLAAGALWAHLSPLVALNAVGLGSTLAMLYLIDRILLQLDANGQQRTLALALLAIGGSWWAIHAMSGLETMLYTALLLASTLLYLRRSAWLPLACLLAALTRPEGALVAVALAITDRWERPAPEEGVYIWPRGRNTWGWAIGWLAGFLLPGLGYYLWRWSYYGQLLPNTFYTKALGGQASWDHLFNFLIVAVIPLVIAWHHSEPTKTLWRRPLLITFGFVLGLLAVFYGQSELMMNYGNRFFVPYQPLIIAALAASWGKITWRSAGLAAYTLLSLIYLAGSATNCYYYAVMEREEHTAAAAWIADHAPADATLMVMVDAGLVPYRTNLRTIDAGGLNDAYLSHERDPQARADYLLNQQADIVLLATGDLGIAAANATRGELLADPRWIAGYHREQIFRRQLQFDYHQEVWVRNGTSLR